ncbi:MAG: hypothetical protein EXS58_11680 [Candidatus Latescibacteria bacterium]|nr:hypothetical protein [Candidatus Latescibacterota bacterium]
MPLSAERGVFIGSKGGTRAVESALQAQGTEGFHTAYLTEDHPIFSAMYDLQKEPIPGEQNHVPTLTGCFVEDRLPGVFADGLLWNALKNYKDQAVLPARIKLTVNLMVYAQQQEGSLTWRRQHPEGTSNTDPKPTIKK